LQQELQRQQVDDFRIWEGIRDPECPQRGIWKAHKQIIAWAAAHRCPQVLIAEDFAKTSIMTERWQALGSLSSVILWSSASGMAIAIITIGLFAFHP
jgi:hypothetical protein